MLELTENMNKDQDGDQALEDFKLLLLISHYLAVRAAVQSQKALSEVATKVERVKKSGYNSSLSAVFCERLLC